MESKNLDVTGDRLCEYEGRLSACRRCFHQRHHHHHHHRQHHHPSPQHRQHPGSLCCLCSSNVVNNCNDGILKHNFHFMEHDEMSAERIKFRENKLNGNEEECGGVKYFKKFYMQNNYPCSTSVSEMPLCLSSCRRRERWSDSCEECSAYGHGCTSKHLSSTDELQFSTRKQSHIPGTSLQAKARFHHNKIPSSSVLPSFSKSYVILASKNIKMFTILLPFIISIVVSSCDASHIWNSSQSPPSSSTFMQSPTTTQMSSGEEANLSGPTNSKTHRFDLSRSSSHWMETNPSVSPPPTPVSDGNFPTIQRSPSQKSSDWSVAVAGDKMGINTIINNDMREAVDRHGISFSPSPKQKSRQTMKTSGSLVGVPFVRAHSTGFISLMDTDEESTKAGASVSSASGTLVGRNMIMLTPQLLGMPGSDETSSRLLKVGSCLCWNTTDDGQKREVECKCTGEEMTNVTSSLPSDIHRLTVEHAANFTTLGNEDLKPYGNALTELVLTELPSFQTFRNGTFLGMKRLNTIYIHGTPALTQIEDAALTVYLPELKIIRITHSGLEVVPNLSQLHIKTDAALHMVELDNNKIARMIPGSFKGLVTEHLALSYNNLEEIGPSAFEGSTIARLTLKGNPLKTLHSNSFVGIDSLRVLDLSETQITYLPTQGLNGLESLRLEKVWTLSVIPSIYHFQVLEEAWLTWPYHCCAFEYPETHDPAAFQRYKEYVRSVVNELCAKASANTSTSSTELPNKVTDENGDDGGGFTGNNESSPTELNGSVGAQRRKRHLLLLEKYGKSNPTLRSSRSGGPYGKSKFFTSTSPSEAKVMDDANGYSGGVGADTFYWNNENTQVHSLNNVYVTKRFSSADGKTIINRMVINDSPVSGGMTTSNPPHIPIPSSSFRLRKRSLNGHHPRLALAQRNGNEANGNGAGSEGFPKSDKMEDGRSDGAGFHHPHVLHGGGAAVSVGNGNPPSYHAFDSDDESTLHYGKIGPEDAFDPFVFDPDQSFAPIEPHDLEHESDIFGKDPWGTFGVGSEAEFDEDIGIFHPSVTPSPTVITLCGNVAVKRPPKIACHPLPDAFNPCEDIMGSIWLRGAVWVVVALALIGNTAVLVVLLLAPGRISVQRFLMANLSWADLCMGIYLLMVATQDLVSLGSYFNYAIDWQLGWGCQIAGFLTVFASELSVFTLAVITGERWYALTRAIHLTKRLTLLGAAQLMAFGWFMATLLAALPLMGVSSYSKTSICLPMEASSGGAVTYLVFLLLFNGVAFFLVACAYWQMYRAVAGHGRSGGGGAAPAASSADAAIAKKMAMLVFTDFACWAPVAFFGLTAVGGMPLIGVTDSKILLVFFYPLNACCNPYLYAILTKQYRRDLLLLLSRHGICTKRAARFKTGAASNTNNTMQTMQTVLRMGSMTETKVTGGGGSGRGGLLNGARPSVAGGASPLLEETLLVIPTSVEAKEKQRSNNSTCSGGGLSPGIISSSSSSPNKLSKNNLQTLQTNILNHPSDSMLKSSSEDLRKALNLQPPSPDEDDDDVFDLNGLSGRHLAETTFISIPLSPNAGGKLMTNKISDPAKEKLIQPTQQNNILSSSPIRNHNSNNSTVLKKDEHDLDNEITEATPFCLVRN